MKYRKKPVVIDALQWTGKNHREMYDFLTENAFDKENMKVSGEHFYIDHSKVEGGLVIKTLEGEHLATIGDYIIRGVKGEYYPCKEDIFHQTYDELIEHDAPDYAKHYHVPNLDWVDPFKVLGPNDKVPFHTICSCNPHNGGNGICGCTIANKLVDRVPTTNLTTQTTTTSEEQTINFKPVRDNNFPKI